MKKLMSAILALLMVLSVASFAGAESEPIKLTWAMGTGDVAPIDNAMVLEEVARMNLYTEMLNPGVQPAPQCIQDKHFLRKHGPGAYYGQGKQR